MSNHGSFQKMAQLRIWSSFLYTSWGKIWVETAKHHRKYFITGPEIRHPSPHKLPLHTPAVSNQYCRPLHRTQITKFRRNGGITATFLWKIKGYFYCIWLIFLLVRMIWINWISPAKTFLGSALESEHNTTFSWPTKLWEMCLSSCFQFIVQSQISSHLRWRPLDLLTKCQLDVPLGQVDTLCLSALSLHSI